MQQELKNIAKNATDVPKGTPTGKALGAAQLDSIDTIRAISVKGFSGLQGHSALAKQGKATSALNQLWKLAEVAKNDLHLHVDRLSSFSKSGNVDANQKIQKAIESATEKLRLLADYMR